MYYTEQPLEGQEVGAAETPWTEAIRGTLEACRTKTARKNFAAELAKEGALLELTELTSTWRGFAWGRLAGLLKLLRDHNPEVDEPVTEEEWFGLLLPYAIEIGAHDRAFGRKEAQRLLTYHLPLHLAHTEGRAHFERAWHDAVARRNAVAARTASGPVRWMPSMKDIVATLGVTDAKCVRLKLRGFGCVDRDETALKQRHRASDRAYQMKRRRAQGKTSKPIGERVLHAYGYFGEESFSSFRRRPKDERDVMVAAARDRHAAAQGGMVELEHDTSTPIEETIEIDASYSPSITEPEPYVWPDEDDYAYLVPLDHTEP